MVTMQPDKSSMRRSSGIAGISLDCSSVASCARTSRFSTAQALTRWNAFLPFAPSYDRRRVFPSMATTPRTCSVRLPTHVKKLFSNSSGFILENTLLLVSWDGMPLDSSRIVSSHSCFTFPNCSISSHTSAPQITAQIAIMMISINLCNFVRSIRGSTIFPKLSSHEIICLFFMKLFTDLRSFECGVRLQTSLFYHPFFSPFHARTHATRSLPERSTSSVYLFLKRNYQTSLAFYS